VKHKVGKYEFCAPFNPIKGKKYPEANKKINPVQIIGVWLTHTLPESKIGPEDLVIEEI
tara:strand:+ start:216 stop:392 length:177 start_codon:yes stop_codon:yes gene_type:complete